MGRYHAENSSEEVYHLASFQSKNDKCCINIGLLIGIIGIIFGIIGINIINANDDYFDYRRCDCSTYDNKKDAYDSGVVMALAGFFGGGFLVLWALWLLLFNRQFSIIIDKSLNLVYFIQTDLLFYSMNINLLVKKKLLIGPLNRILCATHSRTVTNYIDAATGAKAGQTEINQIYIHFNNENIQNAGENLPPIELPIVKSPIKHNEVREAIIMLNQLFNKNNNTANTTTV